MRLISLLALACSLLACTGMPENIKPIQQLDLNRYLGTWYEIARLDHSFERGLEQVTATYALREDGGVSVTNRGYDSEHGEWKEAVGKAYFVEDETTGHLKVSFFGPFYASYVIFELDDDYQYAYITGHNKSYLWLLSRTPTVDDALLQKFTTRVKALGYASEALIKVKQQ